MKSNAYLMSKVVIVAALAVGAVGVANAGMGRFEDVYKYFDKLPVDNAPSAWRKDHPNGLSEQQLQAMSSDGPAWQPPVAVVASEPKLAYWEDIAQRSSSNCTRSLGNYGVLCPKSRP